MDLQNVSDINIPEGDVRTIHDKNSRLLWGKLSYDTKYAGDTIQDGSPTPDAPVAIQTVTGVQTVTVSGKNLFNWAALSEASGDYANATLGEWGTKGIVITGNASTGSEFASSRGVFRPTASSTNSQYRVPLSAGSTITISADVTLLEDNYRPNIRISLDPGGTAGNSIALVLNETIRVSQTFSNIAEGTYRPTFSLNSNKLKIENIQIESGATPTTYELYQSHDYTVDLGTIELCKLGNYQDYIYKSGSDWYLHKDINREDLDGSSDEQWVHQTGGGDTYHNWFQHNFEYPSVSDGNARKLIISNNFTNIGGINYQTTTEGMGTLIGNVRFRWNMGEINNATKWRAFLGEHPTTVYYMMDTPIETQIADATLISQLDAIHQFLTRYGYNSTVSGNLPLIISKTNL